MNSITIGVLATYSYSKTPYAKPTTIITGSSFYDYALQLYFGSVSSNIDNLTYLKYISVNIDSIRKIIDMMHPAIVMLVVIAATFSSICA